MNNKHISKFLSLVLRHQPEKLGIRPDPQGWVSVKELLEKLQENGMAVSLAKLQEVVASNDKQRFAFSADGSRIRASQGHSIAVDLGLEPLVPPAVLYHGTALQHIPAIRTAGLLPGKRQHVHLSADPDTALKVGSRHGKPALLLVESLKMQQADYRFYRSANGVWLTHTVPPLYLQLMKQEKE